MGPNMTHPVSLAAALAFAAALGAAGPVMAQSGTSPAPDALRSAPPEMDRSRPGGDPAAPPGDRSGGGPTDNDTVEGRQDGSTGRGVIRPPMSVDPGIRGSVPDPAPPTTPVNPPPGMPGGDSRIDPR